jgi:hypothetical protein
MKSQLAQKLKEVLDNMSQEQFDMEWNAISSLNMEGPTFEEAIEYFSIPDSNASSFVLAQENEFNQPFVAGENNYALAS